MVRTVPAATAALVLVVCPGAWAGSSTDALHGFFTAANTVLLTPETAGQPMERLRAIRKLVNDAFDFRGAAEIALGREWHARTPAEQQEFVRLFADLVERAYVFRVAAQARLNDGVRIRYIGESVVEGVATVQTAAESKGGGEVRFDYRMIKRGERWLVRDVVIEGVSVVANYRAQFHRIIQGSSYPELVERMLAKASDAARVSTPAVEAAVSEPAMRRPPQIGDTPRAALSERSFEFDARPSAMSAARAPALSYWVQVGAFRNADAAGRLAARLQDENVILFHGQGRPAAGDRDVLLVRVRVGPFSDRADAVSKLRGLRAKGYKPFLFEGRE